MSTLKTHPRGVLTLLSLYQARERSIVMSMYVCVFSYLSVCLLAYLQNYTSNLHSFSCMLHIAIARSYSGGVAIRSVLPVLWMMPCLHIMAKNRRR